MGRYVDVSIYTVLREGRAAFDLQDFITEAQYTVTKTKTAVATINKQKTARGHTRSTQEIGIEMTAMIPFGVAHPFNQIHVNDEIFGLHGAHLGGERVTFVGCEISELSAKTDNEKVELTMSIVSTNGRFSDA